MGQTNLIKVGTVGTEWGQVWGQNKPLLVIKIDSKKVPVPTVPTKKMTLHARANRDTRVLYFSPHMCMCCFGGDSGDKRKKWPLILLFLCS